MTRVLIVDDSLTVRMDLADAFIAAGFDALPCASIAQAHAALAQGPVDVAVLDVILPDGDGIELLKELRSQPEHAAAVVVMLSTEADVKDRVRGLRTGADEYVGKPYDSAYVVAKVRALLRERHGQPVTDRVRMLVIDDSVTFREQLREALTAAGYAVIVASTGEEGLIMAADHRPEMIVVDGVLPGIDGAAVIRRLRLDSALRGVPCVLLTATQEREAELRALDAGADAFVRKDEDIEIILARLTAVLRRSDNTPAELAHSTLGPKKVLAVDDSKTYLNALAAQLRSDGYDVVLANNGEEALDLLGAQAVDCILLDLMMPGLGGQETCRRIKTTPIVRDTPLIMLTAKDDRVAMLEGLGAGADDYISKSSEFEVLKARVRAQIRRKQFEDDNRRIREELLRKEIETTEARAAQALAEARAVLVNELEQKNRELEAFSYSVSHDLRAPLRSMDGFSKILLEEHSAQLDETGLGYLRRVCAAAERMDALIEDMLHLSQVSRAVVRQEPVNLTLIGQQIIRTLCERDEQRKISVQIEAGMCCTGDSGLLRIVLENLLGNAWKFSSKMAQATISFGREDSNEGPAFFIRDNGAGFDMAYAAKLFQPFNRLHAAEDFPGTGIGLATVQRVISRHAGRVWVVSAIGKGATFYFTIGKFAASNLK